MTLLKPGGLREFAPQNYARQVRLMSSALLQGVDGLRKASDFTVSGSNTDMTAQITAGLALLHYPGTLQGANPFASDATESRTISAAPATGTRYDVLGIQVWDKEYGDTLDDWDLKIVTNPAIGSQVLPVPSPATAKWWPLYKIAVPHGATRANMCTFTRLATVAAYMKDGKYGAGEVAFPDQPIVTHHTNSVRADGWVYSFVVPAPISYSTIVIVPTSPLSGTPDIFGGYGLDRSRLTPVDFWFRAYSANGGALPEGTAIQYDAVYMPLSYLSGD